MEKESSKTVQSILQKIKSERHLDFSKYRQQLLTRRIMARARISHCHSLEEYERFLNSHPEEVDRLIDKITINVTELFRDQSVFEAIHKKVLPEILLRKGYSSGGKIRIWSCACATGREAYSILLLLKDLLGDGYDPRRIELLGTDIDEQSIEKARSFQILHSEVSKLKGVFKRIAEAHLMDVEDGYLELPEELRASVKFVRHDICNDLNNKNFDLILCRNLFIYFQRDLQLSVMRRVCKRLSNGGDLVMGLVEDLPNEIKDLFDLTDFSLRIFRKMKAHNK